MTSPPDSGKIRIYVIDDDSAVLDSTALLLRAMGYECDSFADPVDFLACVQRLPEGFILTDLKMPGLDGRQLASELRVRSVDWPVLLMSSEDVRDAQDGSRTHGFVAFLCKPLHVQALAEALNTAIASLPPRR